MHTSLLAPALRCLALAAALLPAAASAQLVPDGPYSYKVIGTNQVTGTGPVTTTLGGVTFTNHGLVGVGRVPATALDVWGESLGSVSGMHILPGSWQSTGNGTYGGTFMILPDRGYNDGSYFSDYAARMQRLDFTFTPYTGAGPVAQDQLQLTYNGTGSVQFTYHNGTSFDTTTGLDPGANTTTLFGQTMPFATGQVIGNATVPVNKLTVDAEALILRPDGSGYITDEYGPNIYHFNTQHQIVGVITPPAALQPHTPAGTLNFNSINAPSNGRRNNQGLEGAALSPDGTKLYALLQSATVQDTNGSQQQTRRNTRLLVYDVSANATPTTAIAEYAVQLPVFNNNGNAAGAMDRTGAQSEILVLDENHILILSRDGNGQGAGGNAIVFKSVLLADLSGATNLINSFDGEAQQISPGGVLRPEIIAAETAEAVNLLNATQLAAFGLNLNLPAYNTNTLSEKWEGLSLLPALDPLNPNDYFLFVGNDNDFLTTNGFMRQADGSFYNYNAGQNNDTMFLAYRVTLAADPVPEPAEWAAMAGVAALGLALWRRRRLVRQ